MPAEALYPQHIFQDPPVIDSVPSKNIFEKEYLPEPYALSVEQRTNAEEKKEKGEPISKTWRPLDEALFLKNNPQLSAQQSDIYIRRSADNFLLEHSFEVPFSFFVGQLAPDGHMYIQGTDMSTSWTRVRERYGVGSNEDYETQGYEKAHEMLRMGAHGAIISSPQKPGVDRRFTFALVKGLPYGHNNDNAIADQDGGEWFTQINLTHKGDRITFDRAKQDYANLEELTGQQIRYADSMKSNRDMLVRPIAITDTSSEVLDKVLSNVGIGEAEITRSYELQRLANNDEQLSDDLNAYVATVRKLAQFDLQNLGFEGTEVLKDAEALRNGIYLRANELYEHYKNQKGGKSMRHVLSRSTAMSQADRIILWRNQDDPLIYGGISCPTASDSSSIWNDLQKGTSMSGATGEKTVVCKECPVCKAENITAKVYGGKIHCPECSAEAPYDC